MDHEKEISAAINVLAAKIVPSMPDDQAIRVTQALLNLTHAAATLRAMSPKQ